MVFPTMRVPRDRPLHAPGGGGRALVAGPVNLGLGRTLPRLPRGAEQIRTSRRFQAGGGPGALAAPLTSGLAVHPTA